MKGKCKQHDIKGLLTELDGAQQEYLGVLEDLRSAMGFFQYYKGSLNEHQFATMLEKVSHDHAQAAKLIDRQQRLRCNYQMGLVAMVAAVGRLQMGGRGQGRFASIVSKIGITIDKLGDDFNRHLLGSKALHAAQGTNQVYDDLWARYCKAVEGADISHGQPVQSLQEVYAKVCAGDFSGVEFNTKQPLESTVHFALLQRMSQPQWGEAENDRLARAGRSIMGCLAENRQAKLWEEYRHEKAELNETQYSRRLQEAITNGCQHTVDSLKQQQRQKRINFLVSLSALGEYYQTLVEMLQEVTEAVSALKRHLRERKDRSYAPVQTMMSNVIAAATIYEHIRQLLKRWGEELEKTRELRSSAQNSLEEVFGELLKNSPYSRWRWDYIAPGEYREVL